MIPTVVATTAATWDISGSLSTLGDIVSNCLNWIRDNTVLQVIFVAGLIPAGFMVIRKAKRASKA